MPWADLGDFAIPFVAVFGLALIMLYLTFRRGMAVRDRVMSLSDEHTRLMTYAQLRLAAQREQARAAKVEGPERLNHLREAIDLWRQANQHRPPEDEGAFQSICDTIAMLEEDIAALREQHEPEQPQQDAPEGLR